MSTSTDKLVRFQPRPDDTYPADSLVYLRLKGARKRHPVPSIAVVVGKVNVEIFPVTYPSETKGNLVTKVTHAMTLWLLLDRVVGYLPLTATDWHMARAVAEHWAGQLASRKVNPRDPDSILRWAGELLARSPHGVQALADVESLPTPPPSSID
jgi:hypothetical protein